MSRSMRGVMVTIRGVNNSRYCGHMCIIIMSFKNMETIHKLLLRTENKLTVRWREVGGMGKMGDGY